MVSCRKHFVVLSVPDEVVVDVSTVGDTGRHPGDLQTVCPNLAKGQISGGWYSYCEERRSVQNVFNDEEVYEDTLPSLKREESVVDVCVCDPCLKFYDILKVREQAACASGGKTRLSMIKTPQLKPDGPRVHALAEDY